MDGISRLFGGTQPTVTDSEPILPVTNIPVTANTAVTSGSKPATGSDLFIRRNTGVENKIREDFDKQRNNEKKEETNKNPAALPPKVSDGQYSLGRIGKQLFKTTSKVGADGLALFCTPPTMLGLAAYNLSPEALNAATSSLGVTAGVTQSNGSTNGYTLTFKDTLIGFGTLSLSGYIFQSYQKLFRGLLKNASETGKHTTDSAAAENALNMLKYVLTEENIAKMPAEQQKAATEAMAALKSNAGAISHAKKFYDVSKLVATTDQQYDVAKDSFVDTLPLRETPGWRDETKRLEITETLVRMTNDYQNPMTRQKVRANFYTHGCRSVERMIPGSMKKKTPFDVTGWEVPEDFIIPEEVDLHVWHGVPEKPNHLLYLLGLPGTGKSHLKRIAEYMDSPFFGLGFPDITKGGYDSIGSAKWSLWDQTDIKTKDNLIHGEQIQKMKREKCSNPIVNFDEPHFSDVGGVKKAFDNWGSKKNYSDCVGMPTTSNHFALVTANSAPEIPGDEILTPEEIFHKMIAPVVSRSDVALFGESSKQEIAKDALAAYLRLASMVSLPMVGGEKQELTESQQKETQSILKSCLPSIVEIHHKKFGALRTDSMMETLIGTIAIALTTGRLPANKERKNEIPIPPPEEGRKAMLNETFKTWIEDYYEPIRTLNPYQVKREKEQAKKDKIARGTSGEEFMGKFSEIAPADTQVKLTAKQYHEAMTALKRMAPPNMPLRNSIANNKGLRNLELVNTYRKNNDVEFPRGSR